VLTLQEKFVSYQPTSELSPGAVQCVGSSPQNMLYPNSRLYPPVRKRTVKLKWQSRAPCTNKLLPQQPPE